MRLLDLFTNYDPNSNAPPPWQLEETRTFTCPCGHVWVLPEDSLQCYHDGKKVAFTVSEKHFTGQCPACQRANFELLSFMNRYEMIEGEKPEKVEPMPGPLLDYGGGA